MGRRYRHAWCMYKDEESTEQVVQICLLNCLAFLFFVRFLFLFVFLFPLLRIPGWFMLACSHQKGATSWKMPLMRSLKAGKPRSSWPYIMSTSCTSGVIISSATLASPVLQISANLSAASASCKSPCLHNVGNRRHCSTTRRTVVHRRSTTLHMHSACIEALAIYT